MQRTNKMAVDDINARGGIKSMGGAKLKLIMGDHEAKKEVAKSVAERLIQEGTTILLVEQNIHYALHMAQRAYVLENGQIIKHGPARELLQDDHIRKTYLGL